MYTSKAVRLCLDATALHIGGSYFLSSSFASSKRVFSVMFPRSSIRSFKVRRFFFQKRRGSPCSKTSAASRWLIARSIFASAELLVLLFLLGSCKVFMPCILRYIALELC